MTSSLSYPEGRFYEEDFPEVDDIVVVQVKRIVDMGAYVDLLEYNNREGMMLLSELSKRRIRSVAKLLKVGRVEICMVLRADRDKGYIDLSKRRVEPDDAVTKEEAFAKAKAVHGIMRHVASTHQLDLEDFCQKFSWPLYRKYGNAYDAYKKHINEEINVWDELSFTEPGVDLSEYADKIKADIDLHLVRKLITSMLRFEARVDVACTAYEGIEAIKRALNAGLKKASEAREDSKDEECEVKIKLIAHPTFVLNAMCREKGRGIRTLQLACDTIKEVIEQEGGSYTLVREPQLTNVNDTDTDPKGTDTDPDTTDTDTTGMGDLDDVIPPEWQAAEDGEEGSDGEKEDEKEKEKDKDKDKKKKKDKK